MHYRIHSPWNIIQTSFKQIQVIKRSAGECTAARSTNWILYYMKTLRVIFIELQRKQVQWKTVYSELYHMVHVNSWRYVRALSQVTTIATDWNGLICRLCFYDMLRYDAAIAYSTKIKYQNNIYRSNLSDRYIYIQKRIYANISTHFAVVFFNANGTQC